LLIQASDASRADGDTSIDTTCSFEVLIAGAFEKIDDTSVVNTFHHARVVDSWYEVHSTSSASAFP
jgi:hypothetical protein